MHPSTPLPPFSHPAAALRIVALSDFPLGSLRAHAINVIKTAGGFLRRGHHVTLLCNAPDLASSTVPVPSTTPHSPASTAQLLASYGEPNLPVETLPTDPAQDFTSWSASRAAALQPDLVYARHFAAALACSSRGLPTILETHAHVADPNPLLSDCCRATRDPSARAGDGATGTPLTIATISPVLRDYYIALGADPARIAVIPDGVDTDLFSPRASASPFTASPRHPITASPSPNLLYSGHLYDYKGIPTILAAAKLAPAMNFHLLGGAPEDIARLSATIAAAHITNVFLRGPVSHAHVPPWLWHADALLLPPTARHPSAVWTSPVKLGEYLASERPIIASRIRGLTAWVHESSVRFFTPDDPRDMLRAIAESLRESDTERAARIRHARVLASSFSYANRADRLIDAALAAP